MNKIEGKRLTIDDKVNSNPTIDSFIEPYRIHIEKDLDSALAYAVGTYHKNDGVLNSTIGNLMADVIKLEANPIFKKKTGNSIDAVILNHGGIRAELPKGIVNARTAYNIMPFENEVVVVGLKGKQIKKAIDYLISGRRAHPISGMQIVVDADYNLLYTTINDEPIDENKTYYVATSDYLFNNGDNMSFYKPNESVLVLNYKIRNILIDYFKKVDTINPVRDQRFVIKQY
ncbi:MAG: 5'-nucleotidase C-terminal domain-containing protein [Jejuia sp.]